DRAVTAGAELRIVDTGAAQTRTDEGRDVDVRLGVTGARDAVPGELPRDLLPHLEAADADGRAEPGVGGAADGVEGSVDDALHRAAPAAVAVGDDAAADGGGGAAD